MIYYPNMLPTQQEASVSRVRKPTFLPRTEML